MTGRLAVTVAIGMLLAAANAGAQTPGWTDRGYINVNGGYQGTSNDFVNTVGFVTDLENGNFVTSYTVKRRPQFDIGGGIRVWRGLAVGIGVSRLSDTEAAAVTAQIPHPFFFNTPRTVAGQTGGLTREETAVHLQALWMAPVGEHFQIGVFGGPSLYDVKQDFVSDVNYSEAYPFDTASFVGVAITQQSKSKVGFNAGVDLTYFFSRHVGVGGLVRFSRASVDFSAPDEQTFKVDAGGAQAGAGLRLRF